MLNGNKSKSGLEFSMGKGRGHMGKVVVVHMGNRRVGAGEARMGTDTDTGTGTGTGMGMDTGKEIRTVLPKLPNLPDLPALAPANRSTHR